MPNNPGPPVAETSPQSFSRLRSLYGGLSSLLGGLSVGAAWAHVELAAVIDHWRGTLVFGQLARFGWVRAASEGESVLRTAGAPTIVTDQGVVYLPFFLSVALGLGAILTSCLAESRGEESAWSAPGFMGGVAGLSWMTGAPGGIVVVVALLVIQRIRKRRLAFAEAQVANPQPISPCVLHSFSFSAS